MSSSDLLVALQCFHVISYTFLVMFISSIALNLKLSILCLWKASNDIELLQQYRRCGEVTVLDRKMYIYKLPVMNYVLAAWKIISDSCD